MKSSKNSAIYFLFYFHHGIRARSYLKEKEREREKAAMGDVNDPKEPNQTSMAPKFGDPSDPLYLHHSDQPGLVLVSQTLTEENYSTWSHSMTMALTVKNKHGFVDGSVKQPK